MQDANRLTTTQALTSQLVSRVLNVAVHSMIPMLHLVGIPYEPQRRRDVDTHLKGLTANAILCTRC
jgi:hypothetical protein